MLYLTSRLRHVCEVVRLGKYSVRRMFNNLGVRSIRAWNATFCEVHKNAPLSPRIRSGPEFHADVSFWRLLVAGGLGSPTGRFYTPSYRSYTRSRPRFACGRTSSATPWRAFVFCLSPA